MNAQQLRRDRIHVLDGVVAPDRCRDAVQQLRYAFWAPSRVTNAALEASGLGGYRSAMRTSSSTSATWFTPALNELTRQVGARVGAEYGVPADCLEAWQATSYQVGGHFDSHNDAGAWPDRPEGERTVTVLLYLDEPADGGATTFPALDITIRPKPGRLVVWRNTLDDGCVDLTMHHGALPVVDGVKHVLVTWGHENARVDPHPDPQGASNHD